MRAQGLAAVFLSARAELRRAGTPVPEEAPEAAADLEACLVDLLALGRAAWPMLVVPEEAFVRHLAERAGPGQPGAGALDPARAADLFVACACGASDGAAIAAFEQRFFPEIRRALGRLRLDESGLDEALQQLRRELFVAEPGARPKIAEYGGSGDLRGWLRVTATRSALKLMRARRRTAPLEDEQLLERVPLAVADDPDLAYMKEVYRPAFRAAFQEALDSLSSQEQNLLRQHVLDRLSVDQIGALYRVHRATAARWLASARQALIDGTRKRFMANVRIGRDECESILRACDSQLDGTIRRRIAATGE